MTATDSVSPDSVPTTRDPGVLHHLSPISGVDAFAGLVATAGYDNQLILWDAAEKTMLACGRHDHLVNQCRFSPAGNLLVSAGSDYKARIWSVPDLRPVAVLAHHEDDVEMAAFDPAGARVATASRDSQIRIFGVDGQLQACLAGHTADVLSVEWADADHLVSTSDDGTLRRWHVGRASTVDVVDFDSVETDTFALLRPGEDVCVGTDTGELTILRAGTRRTFAAHRSGIKRVVADSRGRVLTTSYDRTAKLWQARGDGRIDLIAEIDLPTSIWARAAVFAGPDRIVFGTFGTTFATYSISTGTWDVSGVEVTRGINCISLLPAGVHTVGDAGEVRRGGRLVGKVGSPCNFLVHAAGRTLTGGQSGSLVDAQTGSVLYQHWSPLNCAVVVDDLLLIGAYTGEVVVFCTHAGRIVHKESVRVHTNAVKALAAGHGRLFSVCATGAAAFHMLPDLRLARQVGHGHSRIANGAAALPDGMFASVGRDLMLRLWSPDGSGVAVTTLHTHSIKCVASSADGHLLATGAYDGMVAVYDRRIPQWTHAVRPTTSGISSIIENPRAPGFLAASFDGHVYPVPVP